MKLQEKHKEFVVRHFGRFYEINRHRRRIHGEI